MVKSMVSIAQRFDEYYESDFARAAAAGKGDLALAAAGPVTAGI